MQAELRQLLTIEGDFPTEFQPRDEAFCYWLKAMVGPSDLAGEEAFNFAVCSPAWLKNELERNPIIDGRCLFITDCFDPQAIESYIRKRMAQATGDDWPAVAAKIARWSYWEFEDYRER